MEDIPEDMWTPCKYLYNVIGNCLKGSDESSVVELDICLKKYKKIFTTLFRNPPKNERSRNKLRTAMVGVPNPNHNCAMQLSKDIVDESIIISDMFDLDEFLSLELLCTAQRHLAEHPGLSRGLVAILLYYDGKKAIAFSLRDLFQATSGVSWFSNVQKEITNLISSFTENLVNNGDVLQKIIDILETLNLKNEIEMLTENRAFGSRKHRHQILQLLSETRLALATTLFSWSAQRGLQKKLVAKLLQYFSNNKTIQPAGKIDEVNITMIMAYLYSIDTSIIFLQDNKSITQNLPIINESGFMQKVNEELTTNEDWNNKCLHNFFNFSFGLTLASLRYIQKNETDIYSSVIDRDEKIIDLCLSRKIFDYILNCLLETELIFKFGFFYRRVHLIFTDFIVFMHSKIMELRGKADETARTIVAFAKEGLEPPPNLDQNFEMLMLCIGKFYRKNNCGLLLCMDYWGSQDNASQNSKTYHQSVSLFKFIRLAGELLPTSLFVPYLKMMAGLSSCEQSARNTFNLLNQGTGVYGSATLSWDHFFCSLTKYYSSLRQEHCLGNDTFYKNHLINKSISPEELDGLCAVLEVIKAVATYDSIARVAICENSSWAPINVLLGLLSCPVSIHFKSQIVNTLSALAKTKDTALQLWKFLEISQLISTTPSKSSSNIICNLEVEIEQNECRIETFPLTESILEMLYILVITITPKYLDGGQRKYDFSPYIKFVIDRVFLKYYNRNYKIISEKWEIGEKCLRLVRYILETYEANPDDFTNNIGQESPGFFIMLQLHIKSEFLRNILLIMDDAVVNVDDSNHFYNQEKLKDCSLHCLHIIEYALSKQHLFFDAHSVSNSCILLSGLSKILMDNNPRTKEPDYIMITTKFIMYSSWLPYHALASIKILTLISRLPNIISKIINMFSKSSQSQAEIRQGFAECIDCEINLYNNENKNNFQIEFKIKDAIFTLMQKGFKQSAPNLTYFLLGFGKTKDYSLNQTRRLTAIDSTTNCTKAVISLLDKHLENNKSRLICDLEVERVIEKGYSLLYLLCQNHDTSETILRYLRNCRDFLCRHISGLSSKHFCMSAVLTQISYLLKCTAIELKEATQTAQISRSQYLYELLVGFSKKVSTHSPLPELSYCFKRGPNTYERSAKSCHMRLCELIDCIDLQALCEPPANWEFFENSLMEKTFKDCEVTTENGHNFIDIKKLHNIMNNELQTVQSSLAFGQRQLILQEIESVLLYALKINDEKHKRFAVTKLIEAWTQVAEILFTITPTHVVSVITNQEFILDILQKILNKALSIQAIFELSFLLSGTVLLLLVNLKICNFRKPLQYMERYNYNYEISVNENILKGISKSHALSLKFILRNVLEWIITSEHSSQKLRINLYASLLTIIGIVKDQSFTSFEKRRELFEQSADLLKDVKNTDDDLVRISVEVLRSFGEKLLDIISHDCIVGHDVCKMSALSCIGILIDFEPSANFIQYIANRGYLFNIIQSLLKSDDDLCHVLKNSSENIRALYVYESKMAILLRISNSHVGTELLLADKVLDVLSTMRVFDMHPDIQSNLYVNIHKAEIFVLSRDLRYRKIILPAFNLCENIISTLGPENYSASFQIANFFLSHSNTIETILRCGSPFIELGLLQELSAITGIIARTINQELVAIKKFSQESSISLHRLHHLMLSLFSRFIINESTFKKILKPENILYEPTEENNILHMKYFLKIASNLTLYCRNTISNHSADHRSSGILFSPVMAGVLHESTQKKDYAVTQCLDDILNQLKGSVEYYNTRKLVSDNVLRQKASLLNLNFDEKAQTTFGEFTGRLTAYQNELLHCSFIKDQCLYLLWSHLDFYMHTNKSNIVSPPEEITKFKKNLISVFNETFCKHLLQIDENNGSFNNGFADGLLRRIMSLVHLSVLAKSE